ncbi:MAG: molybdate ABC transporter substrate-binding protein [Symbiobacteriaceae bacterium]|nr:MAG: molybdate ABC transporter substrate-binding protein [Bacillota bacterium]
MCRRLRSRAARVAACLVLLASLGVPACRAMPGPATGPAQSKGTEAAEPVEVLVSAAASLQDALREAAAEFVRQHPDIELRFNFGSSGALAQQVVAGAPVDVFIAAGRQPMDLLIGKGLVDPGSVHVIARNQVVLIAPRDGTAALRGWQDLGGGQVDRIAIGDPAHVPAGQYGRQVLEHLGLWEQVQGKLVLDQDVREVLHHVATGEARAGIVYRTDAAPSDEVVVVAEAPAGSHAPVVYPLAVPKTSRHPEQAWALAGFLSSSQGQVILQRHGFLPPR